MLAHLSSSLGLFAVVWLAFCALSSAFVTDAMLRGLDDRPMSRKDGGTGQTVGRARERLDPEPTANVSEPRSL